MSKNNETVADIVTAKYAEALEKIAHYAEDMCRMDDPYSADWRICADIARKALATPPRNCDIGTLEEQEKRFETFCSLHHLPKGKGCYSCPAIPTKSPLAFNRNVCRINWNKMPYEEGGME